VLKGFNSDISFKGRTYHVQTEDWGLQNPFFVSQVFCQGAVVKTIKIPYTKVLPTQKSHPRKTIQVALEAQHHSVLDLLVSGQLI
jgi:hypothetical protein